MGRIRLPGKGFGSGGGTSASVGGPVLNFDARTLAAIDELTFPNRTGPLSGRLGIGLDRPSSRLQDRELGRSPCPAVSRPAIPLFIRDFVRVSEGADDLPDATV